MRFTILQKYIFAFLGLTLVVLIATLGLARWSFDRGFLNYVNALELKRLNGAVEVIAEEYVRSGGNWESMSQRRFSQLLRTSLPDSRDGPGTSGMSPPPHLRDGPKGRPPRDKGRPPPPGRPPQHPPTALYSAENQLIAGAALSGSADNFNRVPIMVEGVTVGELRSEPRQQLISPQETAFSLQQRRASWVIGGVAMLLALFISVLLARGMLVPVRRMLGDVSRISRGDYSSVLAASDRRDELGELERDLNRLAVTLEEARESRQRWFADISHELRTPVAVLIGELEAVQDGIRKLDEKQVESLMQEVQRLRRLIDDLYELSVSDIGGLRYEFREIDIGENLGLCVASQQARAAERGIDLRLDSESIFIDADSNRIDQLFQNLLMNSLDYTDAPGVIDVQISRRENTVRIVIADSAPGVPAQECERLFEPLHRQESSRSRRTGGAGLGLAICRKIVEAHGGSITASPSTLGGLSVLVELPTRAGEKSS